MKFLNLKIFTITAVIAAQTAAAAQEYNADGVTCASMGQWTRNALAQTQVIRNYINQLKDLKGCQGIEHIQVLLDSAGASLSQNPVTSDNSSKAEILPGNISSLMGAASNVGPSAKPDFLQALYKANVSSALWSAANGRALISAMVPASHAASSALNEIANMLPTYENCLVGHASQGGALLAAVISLTASTAASGGSVFTDFGRSLNSVLTMMKNKKFAVPLRQLAMGEFRNAISCLLETTTESYCAVSDIRHLYETGRLDSNFKYDGKNLRYDSPVRGYYILTQHLDNVIQWIQDVQLGVDPKWSTDAQLKAVTIDNTFGYQKMVWQIQSKFSEAVKSNYNQVRKGDTQSKKNTLFNILQDIVNPMMGNDPFAAQAPAANNWAQFITNGMNPTLIPFYLIGRNSIPKEVAINQPNLPAMAWNEYMKGEGNFERVPEFSDPDALLAVIQARLSELLANGMKKANDYFRSRLIVNQPNLVVRSLVPMPNSVRFSFQMINEYLASLEKRLVSAKGNVTAYDAVKALGQVRVTEHKIKVVLDAYAKLDELREQAVNTDDDVKKVDAYYENVVKTVFDQFDIMRQRDAYLMNAVTNYVYLDYMLRARTGENLGAYEQDLLTVSGRSLTQLLAATHGVDPGKLVADLATATDQNLRNINALEGVFYDSFYGILDELSLIVTGGDTSDHGMNVRARKRLREDVFYNGIARRDNPALYTLSWAVPIIGPLAVRYALRPDQYRQYFSAQGTIREHSDTISGDREFLLAKLCIQSLAFVNRDDFKRICSTFNGGNGVVLKSPYKIDDPHFDLNLSYNTIINTPRSSDQRNGVNWINGKPFDSMKAFREKTLCSFRDWLRRHSAFYLTQDIRNKNY